LGKEVLRLTEGHGVNFIIEAGGIGTIEKSLECVAYGSTISAIGFLTSVAPENRPDVTTLALTKGVNIRGIFVGSKQLLEELTRFAVVNDIHLAIDKEFPFMDDGNQQVFQHLKKQEYIGKICIKVYE
jgi:NADPH:quinone reductase-like Zn-dependent oxidoreductase